MQGDESVMPLYRGRGEQSAQSVESQLKVSRYLAVHNESISSIKMIDGFASLAISNICFTNFSLSPVGRDRKDRDRIDRYASISSRVSSSP